MALAQHKRSFDHLQDVLTTCREKLAMEGFFYFRADLIAMHAFD